jgi:hypothetical protein
MRYFYMNENWESWVSNEFTKEIRGVIADGAGLIVVDMKTGKQWDGGKWEHPLVWKGNRNEHRERNTAAFDAIIERNKRAN